MSFKYSREQASSSPSLGGVLETTPPVLGMARIIGRALPAAMRLSRIKFAKPPELRLPAVQWLSFSPPP